MLTRAALSVSLGLAVRGVGAGDLACPPGTEQRSEPTGEGRAVGCFTPGNLRQGPYTLVHTNGVTRARGQFEANVPVGRWQTWYSNGQKHEEGRYVAGQYSGWWVRWHANGQKEEEGNYRNGYAQGLWRVWDDQGRLISAVPRAVDCPEPLEFQEGRLLPDLHPDPGADIGNHCRRPDGVRQGPAIAWWFARRKLAQVGSYCDGDAQGRWSFFWRNGVLAREGSFAGPSRKQGTWTDWDDRGRKLRETDYLDGREMARRDFSPSGPGAEPDVLVYAVALERYEEVVRQTCSVRSVTFRPYLGLREELNAADAVLRIRATDVVTLDRPPGWDGSSETPARQQIDGVVQRVLAGSLAQPGQRIRLSFAARENAERSRSMSAFRGGVHTDTDSTAFVKREGDHLVLVAVMDANDVERTDAFFEAYARLARLDDGAFALGLAALLAERVRLSPERLLWVNWAWFAFDDWDRLKVPSPPTDARLRRLASETHHAILAQAEGFVRSGEGGVNLSELPWLIRLLSRAERREMAAALLRMHPLFARELAKITRAARPAAHRAEDPNDELTNDDIRAMAAEAAMGQLIHCLAVCVDPFAPVSYPREEALRRARQFVR